MPDPRRWFECDDDGAQWIVVAQDLKEARHSLRETSACFGQEGVSYDDAETQGMISWRELSPEEVAKHTCSCEDGNPQSTDPAVRGRARRAVLL